MARYFLGLCLLVLFAAAVTARPAEDEAADVTTEKAKKGPAETVYNIVKKIFDFTKYRGSCVAKAADLCGVIPKNLKEKIKCYRKYFSDNDEECTKKSRKEKKDE